MNRRIALLPALALLFGSSALWAQEAGDQRRLTIFFSSDIVGNFEPCGCEGEPAGGLARRAGVVSAWQSSHDEPVVQIDLGNYFHKSGARGSVVNPLMHESLGKIPLQVMNLASGDLAQWKELQKAKPQGTQVISTNLAPRRKGSQAPPPYAIVTIAADQVGLDRDLRIGFLGLIDPTRVRPNSGFRGVDPLAAVDRVKDEVMEQADWLIVLADLPRPKNEISADSVFHKLAHRHPEIAAILHTEKRYVLFPPQLVNNAVVLAGVERGRHISRLTFDLDESGKVVEIDHETTELKEGVPEDSFWLSRVQRLKNSLGGRFL